VRAVGNPVDQRLARPGVGNHLRPLREREVGGDDHRCLLSAFGNDLEQELRADFRQRYVSDLVDCDKLVARPSRLRATSKPAKVALVAARHELLLILKAILKTKTVWRLPFPAT
jgi:hypothetical protein